MTHFLWVSVYLSYLFVFECKYVCGECVCVPEHVFVKAELEADAEIMDGC